MREMLKVFGSSAECTPMQARVLACIGGSGFGLWTFGCGPVDKAESLKPKA